MKRRKGGRTTIPLTSFRQRSRGECPSSTILRILNNRDYFLRIFSTSFDHLYSSKPFYKHLSPNRKLIYLENLILSSGYVNLLCFSRQQFPTSRSLILLQRIENGGGGGIAFMEVQILRGRRKILQIDEVKEKRDTGELVLHLVKSTVSSGEGETVSGRNAVIGWKLRSAWQKLHHGVALFTACCHPSGHL